MDTRIELTPDYAPIPKPYNPFRDAIERDIQVGFLPLRAHGTWMPQERAIILSEDLETEVERGNMLAHMLGHVDLEPTRLMRRYRAGKVNQDKLEDRVNWQVSRRLIPATLLSSALDGTSRGAADIADALNVTVTTLAHRVRALTPLEARWIGERADDIDWPYSLRRDCTVCALGTPDQNPGWFLAGMGASAAGLTSLMDLGTIADAVPLAAMHALGFAARTFPLLF
jgi:hypothetical protein